ncbi:hypothetical protein U9M73_12700 [Paenibacillus phoenicis]|uniref:Adhesin domain-containing protein n=1 Tax=Paenibacillus phoenicis TaxID=554117 RepID=A0ABU5PLS7_9BACL|nr:MULTISPECIES: hypothetical protein [Paenibacillus]EES72958.1 hypothetical protein POTG_02365 [Paenibacillus sp. oral taxon 786 str. D14]MCT2194676.1 hypothetical protein [Paenibacillus sp. p3-SID1389]MEA3570846.1 hypothetical protein [Paenibacillus phoenicis]
MRKKRTSQIAWLAASAVLLALASGCGPAENETLQQQWGQTLGNTVDSISQSISETAASVQQSVALAADEWKDDLTFTGRSHDLSTSEAIGNASKLQLENAVGRLELKEGTSDQIVVKATIQAADLPARKEKLDTLFEQSEVTVTSQGNTAQVRVHAKGAPDQNLWDWAQKELHFTEFRIDYVVEVPAGIQEFEVTNHVGEIAASGLTGTYRLKGEVGSIRVEDARLSGDSSIRTATGSINLDILTLDTGGQLQAITDVGSITATLDPSLACDLETSSELGEVIGAAKGRSERGGGGPLVALETSIGSITVQ